MRRRAILLAALAAVAVSAQPAGAAEAGGYVALGDSFSAGPLIPFPTGPPGCLRSDANYAHLLASALGGNSFRDVTCSGARTAEMFRRQDISPGDPVPPQLEALRPRTRLVSLTIGGNDVDFSGVLGDCFTLDPYDDPCRGDYVSGGRDRLSRRIASIAPRVGRVLDAIHARSPRARVFLLNYPPLLPESGDGCWPRQPFAVADVPWLRAKGRELNRMLARVARAGGATLVDWYRAGIGHDPCRPARRRWVEPLLPGFPAAPVHPNARGMRAAAALLLAAIRRPRPAPPAPDPGKMALP